MRHSILILFAFFLSCSPPWAFVLKPLPSAYLVNRNIDIIAEDGSFYAKGGTSFKVIKTGLDHFYTGDISNDYVNALQKEGMRVYVVIDKRDTLHGVLYFGGILQFLKDYNEYTIAIPNRAIENAIKGEISYCAESAIVRKYKFTNGDGTYLNEIYPWILWLSKEKF